MIMYTANAARDGVDGPKFAYQRSFVQVLCSNASLLQQNNP
jgi:hypothetical protein